ncbi:MAG TPA: transcription-repair coupling factor [Anaerolineae bacterium]
MKLNGLLDLGQDRLRSVAGPAPASGLSIYHAARPYAVALLARSRADQGAAPLVVVTARSSRARQWVDELRTWLPDDMPVHLFADPDALPYERIAWAPETRQRRLESLTALVLGQPSPADAGTPFDPVSGAGRGAAPIVVASARALLQMTLPVREMRAALRLLRQDQRFDLNKMLATWVGLGYESAAVVELPGQFSRRGGIVDIWPPNLRKPVRIELFGDEIDSLRTFDPSTQRTLDRLSQAWVGPASEALPKLGERAAERLHALDLANCHPPARVEYEREIEALLNGTGTRNLEWYLPYLYSQPASLLDFLPPEGRLFLDDAAELMTMLEDLNGQAEQLSHDLAAAGDVPGHLLPAYFAASALGERFAERHAVSLAHSLLSSRGSAPAADQSPPAVAASFEAAPRFGGQVRNAVHQIETVLKGGATVVMVTRQAQRMADLWRDAGRVLAPATDVAQPPPSGPILVHGVLDEGWILRGGDEGDLWLLTDAELFGWSKPKPRKAPRPRAVAPEVFFADVSPGDYVVHMEHGIGQFKGLVKMAFDGLEREYLQVDYAHDDRLYVPVHQADRLARYMGVTEIAPPLHRLGTSDWEQLKARTRKAVAEIADELLALYAARAVVQGHAFSPDAPWQAELESSFPYVETEDQLVAIEAVKHDMEQSQPMDRLICGDVGYGKTEVALRAAFKAIMDNKQVAILVPTTVLAQQHFTNFSRRLAAFPVTVAMLSRFQTPAKQQKAIEGLADGSIDLVIGTHRLLSKDVTFKDLGLLIVDEEQRFGVTHKERLKQLRTEVDVLTLTATPIPRTLYMSLTGARDLSTIDTPPEDRLPIKTILAEWDDSLIRQAILRETDRGGQVYFVHNRVQGIEQVASRVSKIVPEARIAIGHGQMPEKELSDVMLAFAEGDYDILVCTSIIESGLDIPNVNTIIINRADQFGLAQLYQLRGRVGRSAVRAYAYLLVDKYKTLTSDARRRLEAIQEASELGAGFRIAMQDLEIRGAGELLGARQHGHIAAVGFDLYTRMLAQAIQDVRDRMDEQRRSARDERARVPQAAGVEATASPTGKAAGEGRADGNGRHGRDEQHNILNDPLAPAVTLDLNIPAVLPEGYVPEAALRLQLYRRLAGLTSLAAIDEIGQEFVDRFGPLPEEVANLLYVVRVKVLAVNAGVESIGQEDNQLLIKAGLLDTLDRARLQERLSAVGIPARVARRAIWLPMRAADQWRKDLVKTLEALREAQASPAA